MPPVDRTNLRFDITFFSAFRISTGQARAGVDAAISRHDPLPGSSLKGLMRAAATELVGVDPRTVGEVFGSAASESPWSWTSANPPAGKWPDPTVHVRLPIDEQTGSAAEGLILFAEELDVPSATFDVLLRRRLDANALATHQAVLRCSAAAVHHLGAARRRGLGWVQLSAADHAPVDRPLLTLAHAGGFNA